MIFRVLIDAKFEADNLDDAFRKFGEYYIALSTGEETDFQYISGKARIGRKYSKEDDNGSRSRKPL